MMMQTTWLDPLAEKCENHVTGEAPRKDPRPGNILKQRAKVPETPKHFRQRRKYGDLAKGQLGADILILFLSLLLFF